MGEPPLPKGQYWIIGDVPPEQAAGIEQYNRQQDLLKKKAAEEDAKKAAEDAKAAEAARQKELATGMSYWVSKPTPRQQFASGGRLQYNPYTKSIFTINPQSKSYLYNVPNPVQSTNISPQVPVSTQLGKTAQQASESNIARAKQQLIEYKRQVQESEPGSAWTVGSAGQEQSMSRENALMGIEKEKADIQKLEETRDRWKEIQSKKEEELTSPITHSMTTLPMQFFSPVDPYGLGTIGTGIGEAIGYTADVLAGKPTESILERESRAIMDVRKSYALYQIGQNQIWKSPTEAFTGGAGAFAVPAVALGVGSLAGTPGIIGTASKWVMRGGMAYQAAETIASPTSANIGLTTMFAGGMVVGKVGGKVVGKTTSITGKLFGKSKILSSRGMEIKPVTGKFTDMTGKLITLEDLGKTLNIVKKESTAGKAAVSRMNADIVDMQMTKPENVVLSEKFSKIGVSETKGKPFSTEDITLKDMEKTLNIVSKKGGIGRSLTEELPELTVQKPFEGVKEILPLSEQAKIAQAEAAARVKAHGGNEISLNDIGKTFNFKSKGLKVGRSLTEQLPELTKQEPFKGVEEILPLKQRAAIAQAEAIARVKAHGGTAITLEDLGKTLKIIKKGGRGGVSLTEGKAFPKIVQYGENVEIIGKDAFIPERVSALKEAEIGIKTGIFKDLFKGEGWKGYKSSGEIVKIPDWFEGRKTISEKPTSKIINVKDVLGNNKGSSSGYTSSGVRQQLVISLKDITQTKTKIKQPHVITEQDLLFADIKRTQRSTMQTVNELKQHLGIGLNTESLGKVKLEPKVMLLPETKQVVFPESTLKFPETNVVQSFLLPIQKSKTATKQKNMLISSQKLAITPVQKQVIRQAITTKQITGQTARQSTYQALEQPTKQTTRQIIRQVAIQLPRLAITPITKQTTQQITRQTITPAFRQTTTLKPPPTILISSGAGSRKPKKTKYLIGFKGKKKSWFTPVPLADLLSVTQTQAATFGVSHQPKITPKITARFGRMLRTGGMRFPTAEQLRWSKGGRKPKRMKLF